MLSPPSLLSVQLSLPESERATEGDENAAARGGSLSPSHALPATLAAPELAREVLWATEAATASLARSAGMYWQWALTARPRTMTKRSVRRTWYSSRRPLMCTGASPAGEPLDASAREAEAAAAEAAEVEIVQLEMVMQAAVRLIRSLPCKSTHSRYWYGASCMHAPIKPTLVRCLVSMQG